MAHTRTLTEANASDTVVVTILGKKYPLRCVTDPQRIRQVATFVDTKMRLVAEGNPSCSTSELAILAALNVADELLTGQSQAPATLSRDEKWAESMLTLLEQRLPHGEASSVA